MGKRARATKENPKMAHERHESHEIPDGLRWLAITGLVSCISCDSWAINPRLDQAWQAMVRARRLSTGTAGAGGKRRDGMVG
jgi:hypothetical protein